MCPPPAPDTPPGFVLAKMDKMKQFLVVWYFRAPSKCPNSEL